MMSLSSLQCNGIYGNLQDRSGCISYVLWFLQHKKTPLTWSLLWVFFQVFLLSNNKRANYRWTHTLTCAHVRCLPLSCCLSLTDQRSSVMTYTEMNNVIKHPRERNKTNARRINSFGFQTYLCFQRLPNFQKPDRLTSEGLQQSLTHRLQVKNRQRIPKLHQENFSLRRLERTGRSLLKFSAQRTAG